MLAPIMKYRYIKYNCVLDTFLSFVPLFLKNHQTIAKKTLRHLPMEHRFNEIQLIDKMYPILSHICAHLYKARLVPFVL